jgi:SAM-dependent methyltransferase
MTSPKPPHDNALGAQMHTQYARRNAAADADRYSLFNPVALQEHQARLRAMVQLWRQHGWHSLADRKVVEVGCGAGGNLGELLRLGATPELLRGIDLLSERIDAARSVLPPTVQLQCANATTAGIDNTSLDAVLAFTVFSSILDANAQQALATAMWSWLRPGGGIMWYDFAYNNPRNPDVQGLPVHRVRALFPHARLQVKWLTLAPPVARAIARLHPALLAPASTLLYPLRTHRLIWAVKESIA